MNRVEELGDRLRQLKALHDSGAIADEVYALARAPLERELVAAAGVTDLAPRPGRGLVLALALAVLLIGVLGYRLTGAPMHAGLGPGAAAPVTDMAGQGEAPVTARQIGELLERMVQRLQERPDDAAGWSLLARSYAAMGRFPEAVAAFERVRALGGEDAAVLADHADVLAAQAEGRFTPEAEGLVARALALEPDNLKALALSGSIAYDRGDFATAVARWERVAAALPQGDAIREQLLAGIGRARQAGGLPVGSRGAVSAAAPATAPADLSASAVSGLVTLSPALAARARPEDTVFVVARPAQGSRMPLVVLRRQVKDLPLSFTLDDSMAMAPGATLSAHREVVIVARVSASGSAASQPGDLLAETAPVAPGSRGVQVEIDTVVP